MFELRAHSAKGDVSQRGIATGDMEYLKVYDAVLMANNRFCIDSQCPSSLSLCGDAALESIRLEVSRLVGFLPLSHETFASTVTSW